MQTNTRDELARAGHNAYFEGDLPDGIERELWFKVVDAILDRLMSPGEGAIKAASETPEMKAVDGLIIFAYVHGQKLETETVPLLAAHRAILSHIKAGK